MAWARTVAVVVPSPLRPRGVDQQLGRRVVHIDLLKYRGPVIRYGDVPEAIDEHRVESLGPKRTLNR